MADKDLNVNPLHPELHASHTQQHSKMALLKEYKAAVAEQVAKGVGGPAFDKERDAFRQLVEVHHVDPKALFKISERIMEDL